MKTRRRWSGLLQLLALQLFLSTGPRRQLCRRGGQPLAWRQGGEDRPGLRPQGVEGAGPGALVRVASPPGPSSWPGHGGGGPLSLEQLRESQALPSILLPPGGWGFVSHHFAQLSTDCWSLALPTLGLLPLSTRLLLRQVVAPGPGSVTFHQLHGPWLPSPAPGSHSCSASLSSAWGPLKEHGAGLPAWSPPGEAWTRDGLRSSRSSQGRPSCAQTCGPCPTCGDQSCPQPLPVLSRGWAPPLPAQPALWAPFRVWVVHVVLSVRAAVPVCCPRAPTRVSL